MEHFTAGRPVIEGGTIGDAAAGSEEEDDESSRRSRNSGDPGAARGAQDGGDIIFP